MKPSSSNVVRRRLRTLAGVMIATPVLAGAGTADAATVTKTYSPTGTQQTFTVPTGVGEVTVVAVGGKGVSRESAPGGFGDRVSAPLSVTPGQTLYVLVGGNGNDLVGGFNGGGDGGVSASAGPGGGAGGGGSDVRTCSITSSASCPDGSDSSLLSRLIVAGGGGGGGDKFGSSPGTPGRGGDARQAGADGTGSNGPGLGGGAGTITGGGAGGPYVGAVGLGEPGQAGSLGEGGDGGDRSQFGSGGGGGGGGLYGGGGASASNSTSGGGGGGSSLVPQGGTVATDTTGSPQVTISYETGPAADIELALAPATIRANGTDTSTATATVSDANGLGVPGQTVTFTSTDPNQGIGQVTDNGDGTYSATITASSTPGTPTISATSGSFTDMASLTQTDATAPDITINSPVDEARFQLGQVVNADYSCADEIDGSGVQTCVGTVADGAPIDTATTGQKTFSVTATDGAGNSATKEVTYEVLDCAGAQERLDRAKDKVKKAKRKVRAADSAAEKRRAKQKLERAKDAERDAQNEVRENCV